MLKFRGLHCMYGYVGLEGVLEGFKTMVAGGGEGVGIVEGGL